jgi:D-3-phosphoglycerate dehydrogenase
VKHARIVASGPVDKVAVEVLKPYGEIQIAPGGHPEDLIPLVDVAIGLILRGDGIANRDVIDAANDLKVIGRTGVGYDRVDIEAATRRGIPVIVTPGANARAVAEATLAFMLALCKNMPYWDRKLKSGAWKSRFGSRPGDLEGKTLGIIGFGNTGQAVAKLAHAFGMTLLASDPYQSGDRASRMGVELVELEVLLRRSDFISLHSALTPETEKLISRESLTLVKRGAYLVNLARGGLVESLDVLYEAIVEGRLEGVGLDVFEPEPPDTAHPIFQLENCITAPHALGMTDGAMTRIFSSMAEDMAAVLAGKRPRYVANPEALSYSSDENSSQEMP